MSAFEADRFNRSRTSPRQNQLPLAATQFKPASVRPTTGNDNSQIMNAAQN
jgi:hypothetical protein